MDQDEVQEAHMNGEHFGNPEPSCWICWEIREPEAPG